MICPKAISVNQLNTPVMNRRQSNVSAGQNQTSLATFA